MPAEDLGVIDAFPWGEAEPNEVELAGPQTIAANTRAMVERSLGRDALRIWRGWGLDSDALCACMRSYVPGEREAADALFDLLHNLKTVSAALANALTRLGRVGRVWGAKALRLPDWDRDEWAAACAELLGASDIGRSERRLAALQFRHLCTPGEAVVQRLTLLSGSADDESSAAALLALRQLDAAD